VKRIPLFQSEKRTNEHSAGQFDRIVVYSLVDDHRYDELMKWKWRYARSKAGNEYGVRCENIVVNGRRKTVKIFIHQVVAGFDWPDHIDGNGLNNQEFNLRSATRSQQMANRRLLSKSTSGEPGVSWHKTTKKWYVRVRKDRKVVFSKLFTSFEEAVQVARQKRREIHGPFVRK
jgi:hypothetical protein